MTISRVPPPLDYLQAASRASLQSFELTRLNHAANLRTEIAALIDQWIQETSEAMLARWMLDHHILASPAKPQSPPSSPPRPITAIVVIRRHPRMRKPTRFTSRPQSPISVFPDLILRSTKIGWSRVILKHRTKPSNKSPSSAPRSASSPFLPLDSPMSQRIIKKTGRPTPKSPTKETTKKLPSDPQKPHNQFSAPDHPSLLPAANPTK
jgi:hypothetical protein